MSVKIAYESYMNFMNLQKHQRLISWHLAASINNYGSNIIRTSSMIPLLVRSDNNNGRLKQMVKFMKLFKRMFITTNVNYFQNNYVMLNNEITSTKSPFLSLSEFSTIPPLKNNKISFAIKNRLKDLTDEIEINLTEKYFKLMQKFDDNFKVTGIDKKIYRELYYLNSQTKGKSAAYQKIMTTTRPSLINLLHLDDRFETAELAYNLLKKRSRGKSLTPDNVIKESVQANILLRTKRFEELDKFVILAIDNQQDPIRITKMTRGLINCALAYLKDPELALKIFINYGLRSYGHLNFTSYIQYKNPLRCFDPIYHEFKNSDELKKFLKNFQEKHADLLTPHHYSCLISTIMGFSYKYQKTKEILTLWKFKIDQHLTLIPRDLTCTLTALLYSKRYQDALELYEKNHLLHADDQFDSLLLIHGKLNDWQKMQQQFEALFGRGELPNLKHYGIVMHALAERGEVKAVDTLWEQLISRKIIPSSYILIALMKAKIYYKDYKAAVGWFQKFSDYSIERPCESYRLLFEALYGLDDLKTQLKVLSHLVKEKKEDLPLTVFYPIVKSCEKIGDINSAKYVIEIIKNEYGHEINDEIHEHVANTFVNAHLYEDARNYIYEIERNLPQQRQLAMKLYNVLMNSYIKEQNYEAVARIMDSINEKKKVLNQEAYAYLLITLICSNKLEQAESLLQNITKGKFEKIECTVIHYNAMMKSLIHMKNYNKAIEIYDTMIDNNIEPNFKSYKYLIDSLIRRSKNIGDREKDLSLAIKVIDTLQENKIKDQLPTPVANLSINLIFDLVNTVVDYSTKNARFILEKYEEYSVDRSRIEEDYRYIYLLLRINAIESNWSRFNQLFDLYIEKISKYFHEDPVTEVKTRSAPIQIKTSLQKIWIYKLEELAESNKISIVLQLFNDLKEKGFIFNNKNINDTAKYLTTFDDTLKDGLRLIESKLIQGYIHLRNKRRFFKLLKQKSDEVKDYHIPYLLTKKYDPKFYLTGLTYMDVIENINTCIIRSYPKKFQRGKYLKELEIEFPHIMKYFRQRRKLVKIWRGLANSHESKKRIIKDENYEETSRKMLLRKRRLAMRNDRNYYQVIRDTPLNN
ncbi:hypothetical protein PACTADRAFT_49965 [Pachysolen tannophilus NRRL Y-2460]|uniref:Mitochondrial 15S rRNA processing factor CCM1 n=1 Tax=Pachysolen tannophilus NRRL Y-2460 TaxID=669874 RepID=A0A1E4TTZ6_PACTA|nr:hypothetical protein PACTADRAFT_49965 [Pachysolen tannophilus NRRL Y-2460]